MTHSLRGWPLVQRFLVSLALFLLAPAWRTLTTLRMNTTSAGYQVASGGNTPHLKYRWFADLISITST